MTTLLDEQNNTATATPPVKPPLTQPPDNGNGRADAARAVHAPHGAPRLRVTESADHLKFMFGVGIECSYPLVAGNQRVDQLRDTGHYEQWKTDLRLVRELGLRYLRYGPPLYKIFLGPNKYDWSFLDAVMAEMKRLGIVPIIDLVHFGLPDWLVDFQNPSWPDYLAEYSRAFAER